MKTYIQIGAGAGDRDPRSNFRDGFSEYIKSKNLSADDRIILVEPNPINIPLLNECWKNYRQAEIYPVGVHVDADAHEPQTIRFYYAKEDVPHYHVFSMSYEHVRRHYPTQEIKFKDVTTVHIQDLLDKAVGADPVEMLALDVEGIDADIVLAIDWTKLNCQNVSIEWLHLGEKADLVANTLAAAGFKFAGIGLDHNGYDHLYKYQHETV
jgi:FkbM family methyltransferase